MLVAVFLFPQLHQCVWGRQINGSAVYTEVGDPVFWLLQRSYWCTNIALEGVNECYERYSILSRVIIMYEI